MQWGFEDGDSTCLKSFPVCVQCRKSLNSLRVCVPSLNLQHVGFCIQGVRSLNVLSVWVLRSESEVTQVCPACEASEIFEDVCPKMFLKFTFNY